MDKNKLSIKQKAKLNLIIKTEKDIGKTLLFYKHYSSCNLILFFTKKDHCIIDIVQIDIDGVTIYRCSSFFDCLKMAEDRDSVTTGNTTTKEAEKLLFNQLNNKNKGVD